MNLKKFYLMKIVHYSNVIVLCLLYEISVLMKLCSPFVKVTYFLIKSIIIEYISLGFQASSALFRHEIAFVLGQLQSICSIPALHQQLSKLDENYMVRHECAETLGSIGTDECRHILETYLNDKERVVRESCEVALDISDYVNSTDFQYCNGLKLVESECC